MNQNQTAKERMLSGDRVTGKLHLGHYAGSLRSRIKLQTRFDSLVMLADVQALTTHFDRPEAIRGHLREMTIDYLAAGIDPNETTIFIQSMIPEIAELTVFFSMFVTVNSLRHNPTIKAESGSRSLGELYYGFLGYPVSQTSDIAFCKATVIPVGEDQLPHLELTRKLVRRFNELYRPVFPEPHAIVSEIPRLVGTDGNAKMSKSLGNTIPLDCTEEELTEKVRKAVTDPARIRRDDPGHPEICPIYSYHRAFRAESAGAIEEACRSGNIGCTECKRCLTHDMNLLLEPMRERRAFYVSRPNDVEDILRAGNRRARELAQGTLAEVRDAMGMNYY